MEINDAFLVKKLRTWYLACHIARRGILDEKNVGEALSWVEGIYKGLLQFFSIFLSSLSLSLIFECVSTISTSSLNQFSAKYSALNEPLPAILNQPFTRVIDEFSLSLFC